MNPAILQFAKAPIQGKVKTRTMPYLNEHEACTLHKRLVTYVLVGLKRFTQLRGGCLELWCTQNHAFFEGLRQQHSVPVKLQQGRCLGERLLSASHQVLCDKDVDTVILVGSDCPFFSDAYLAEVYTKMADPHVDVVIGPAADGGYVLLALKDAHTQLFSDIHWGSGKVFEQTLSQIRRLGLTVWVCKVLNDVDRPEDLKHLPAEIAAPFA